MALPYDEGLLESDTYLAHIWDGSTSPNGYPNIYHSDGASPLPSHFSFDMGKVYTNLIKVKRSVATAVTTPSTSEMQGLQTQQALSLSWRVMIPVGRPTCCRRDGPC